jgi:hypothetical protein
VVVVLAVSFFFLSRPDFYQKNGRGMFHPSGQGRRKITKSTHDKVFMRWLFQEKWTHTHTAGQKKKILAVYRKRRCVERSTFVARTITREKKKKKDGQTGEIKKTSSRVRAALITPELRSI